MRFYHAPAFAASILILSACGSSVGNQPTITFNDRVLPGTSGSISDLTSCPNSGTNTYNLPAATSYNAEITGSNGATPTATYSVATSRTLRVLVTPIGAPNLTHPGYTNWVFPYGCLRLRVTVNGATQTTQILKVDGISQAAGSICANAPSYQVMDFSNDITGNGPASVVISNAEYDNCRAYGNPLIYGCSMSAIFQTHEAEATVQIQGDGNYMCY